MNQQLLQKTLVGTDVIESLTLNMIISFYILLIHYTIVLYSRFALGISPICDAILTDTDYLGNDLSAGGLHGRVQGHMADAEACRQECIKLPACVGFTFVKNDVGDNCAVKETWDESSKVINSCCDSGRVRGECRTGNNPEDASYVQLISKLKCEYKRENDFQP